MNTNLESRVRFGPFELRGSVLRRHGKVVRLSGIDTALLRRLVAGGGATIARAELKRAVWGDEGVSDTRLARAVYTLRRRLAGDDGHPAIETMHGHGYRLSLAVEPVVSATAARAPAAAAPQDLLLRAYEFTGRRTLANLQHATATLELALTVEPNDAEAWALLATVHVVMAMRGCGPRPATHGDAARRVVARARARGVEHQRLASIETWLDAVVDGDGTALGRTRRTTPFTDIGAQAMRGYALASHGLFDLALAELAPAAHEGVLPQGGLFAHAYTLFCMHRIRDARAYLERLLADLPIADAGWHVLALVASHQGDHAVALDAAERALEWSEGLPLHVATLAEALARAGRRADAHQLLEGALEREDAHVPPAAMAPVCLALGNEAAASAWLHRAAAARCPFRGMIRFDPRLADVRVPPELFRSARQAGRSPAPCRAG